MVRKGDGKRGEKVKSSQVSAYHPCPVARVAGGKRGMWDPETVPVRGRMPKVGGLEGGGGAPRKCQYIPHKKARIFLFESVFFFVPKFLKQKWKK